MVVWLHEKNSKHLNFAEKSHQKRTHKKLSKNRKLFNLSAIKLSQEM